MIRFNVVTPTFNDSHKYLIDTIAAVSGQIYDTNKIEVIHTIVDDGSQSLESLAVIERIRDLSFLNFIRQSNGGLPSARNTGIRSICSDYILPLDSDDVIHPCLIQELYNYLESLNFPHNILLSPNMVSFGSYNRRIRIHIPNLYTICKANYLPVSTLFSTSTAVNFPYDVNMINGLEDWELWIRLISNSHHVFNLPIFGFYHREHSANMTHNTLRKYLDVLSYIRSKHSDLYSSSSMKLLRGQCQFTAFDYIKCYTSPHLRHQLTSIFWR